MKRFLKVICPSISLLATGAAMAAFAIPGFELVYTAPVETTLQQDLRLPAEVWAEMFSSAQTSIDIAEFYVTNKAGEPLEPVMAELRKAGERGVKIRFLAERKMAQNSLEGFELLRAIKNLELRVLAFSDVKPDGIIHAKYFVVDRKAAYVGSQNFDWRSLKHIHELGLKITEEEIVKNLEAVFETDWRAYEKVSSGRPVPRLNKTKPKAPSGKKAYLVASPWAFNPPGVGDSESELVRLIGTAQKEIAVQLLDYAPLSFRDHRFYPPIDNAMRNAAVRGVSIKLLVSHWNTDLPALDHLKSLALIPYVQIKVATLPEAKEGFIPFARVVHSKYMVIDGKTLWLGTSNWSGGYLDNSRNVELVIQDEPLAAKVLAVHSQLWDSPYSEKLDVAKEYPKPRRGP
ncbi:MAG: phospholipase [Elusimicrobia bacterium]|nr:phospholipase [Elusimicrobiota bacterium]